jgi:hypothetical protein
MKPGYVLVSVEIWTEDHEIITRRETQIQLDEGFKIKNLTDASQRASANMVELLKDYLENPA